MYDVFYFHKNKRRAKELKLLLNELDGIADVLYNNLQYSGVWNLIQHLEEIRVKYYTEFYECNKVVQLKGKVKK